MRFMPILTKPGMDGQTRTGDVFAGPLPNFYMNDYSVMGLRVNDGPAVFKLLAAHRYTVLDRHGCRGVAVRSVREIRQIIELLTRNGVRGEVADVAEQIYQG